MYNDSNSKGHINNNETKSRTMLHKLPKKTIIDPSIMINFEITQEKCYYYDYMIYLACPY